jgi:hypothetical protein
VAPISQTLALLSFATMSPVSQEFVTVDMRGLKAALVERSRVDRVSVSSLVRAFVARGLGQEEVGQPVGPTRGPGSIASVKLSIGCLRARRSALPTRRGTRIFPKQRTWQK